MSFMSGIDRRVSRQLTSYAAAGIVFATVLIPNAVLADEAGVSFWLPGMFGSLAAVPSQPGFYLNTFFYNTNVNAGANVAIAREFEIGRLNPTLTLAASASLHNDTALEWINPGYEFASPILGGQVSIGLGTFVGWGGTNLNATATASIPPFSVTRTDNLSSSAAGNGDLYPQVFWKWHDGVNNFMLYATGDIPVGVYSSTSLANLGIGHGAADGGLGYTYFDQKSGHELSAVAGFTYNLENTATNYQSGVDFHLDWSASQFLTKQWQVGLVGYLYDQVTGDSGSGDRVGPFESRVVGVGPQLGYIIPLGKPGDLGEMQGYINVKAYGEFDAQDRPSGWNAWLTFVLSPAAPTPSATTKPMYTK
jgi:hypothetical protein